jgi:drug/metabolite transporter (DMT)-like permease
MRPELVLFLGASVWGLGWIPLSHLARQGLSGMPVVLCTFALLCVVAVPVLWMQRRSWWPQRKAMLVIGLGGGWAAAGLVGALSSGDVVRAMLLFYLAPVWSLLGAWWLFGERITRLHVMALALAMLGIALTLGVWGKGASIWRAMDGNDWLALSAGLAFALNNLATRQADAAPVASKALAAFIGAALVAAVACALTWPPSLPVMGPGLWLQIALFCVFWLISMTAAQYGFSHVETSRAAVLVLAELVVAVLTAALLGERVLGWSEWTGSALVLAAALMAGRAPK